MEIDFFNDGRIWVIDSMSVKIGAIAWKAFKQASDGSQSEDFFEVVYQAIDDMLHKMTAEQREEFKSSLRITDIQRILAIGFGMALPDAK